MMSGEAAGEKVEIGIRERQAFGRGFDRGDVVEALLAGRRGDGRQHVGRQVRGRDPRGVGRKRVGDMAAAGAKIQRVLRSSTGGHRAQSLKVGALSVNRALDIGFGARAELGLDDSVMVLGHTGLLKATRSRMAIIETVTI